MNKTEASLVLWIEGTRIGRLSTGNGVWSFEYDTAWIDNPQGYPVSPNLPLSAAPIVDDADDRRVQWFFDNLLPEGGVRTAIAQNARLDEHDTLGLLARYGEESAGALTALPEGQPFPDAKGYEPLHPAELRKLLRDLPSVPFIAAGGRARMSLAGAQHKLGLHQKYDDNDKNPAQDLFLLPRGAAASSIIVKPDNVRHELFPFCPANEYFCMKLANQIGLDVPHTWLCHLPEPLYVVQRFDRVVRDEHVVRNHQIDLCQLLNKWAGYKYESAGGITLKEAFRALDITRQPAVSRNQFLRWIIFNYLIGNSDAHAKNIAFLVSANGIFLAPAYDLLSVAVYGTDYDYMAMTIAGEVRYGWVEHEHWTHLASDLDLTPAFVRRVALELAQRVPVMARKLLKDDPSFTADERSFLTRVLRVIETHAGYLTKQ